MPFWWWNRRRRFWRGRRRTYYKRRKRNTWRKRRPYRRSYRRAHRRRRRRRGKVRRKKKKINIAQWQPQTIRRCKIKGYACNIVGTEGRQFVCYTDNRFAWIPATTPSGGGFAYEKYTLKYLFDEHTRGNNIWTASNNYLDLARYTGCSFIFYRHPRIDFVVKYSRTLPMIVDKTSYNDTHPYSLLLQKHHRLIPSIHHKPQGKKYVKIKIKPPRLMSTKWFFQESLADHGLVQIQAAAADFSYSYQGCCQANNQVTLYILNLQYYKRPGWGNATPSATYANNWYEPRPSIATSKYNSKFRGIDYTGKEVQGKLNIVSDSHGQELYPSSTNRDTGWFNPTLLSIVDLKEPEQVSPLKIHRYNPSVDTGAGNQIYLISVLKLDTYDPPKTDPTLIAEGQPLWKLLFGFVDYVNKVKQDQRFTDSYYLAIVSPAIEPHTGLDRVHIPIDIAMLQGKGRYGDTPTPYRIQHWYPTLEHQMGTINSIVETGPYIPKLAGQRNNTWELKSKYCFYFKWGGAELPEQDVENPKTKGTYIVPDNLKELQISDPTEQKAKHMLHAWDWRRGYLTKSAVKRICQDSESSESFQTDSEEDVPQKKKQKLQGNTVPVLQEKEKEIQTCLQSLFEESTCQETQSQTDLQQLIKQQQHKQQKLKLNLLHLISNLKRKQQLIQLQTGLLD
nr:MAG: ORF1 [Torque teno midi virus]